MRESDCGVVYITSGAFHAAAAAQSALSVRKTNPWLAIDIFTDVEPEPGIFDQVHRFEAGHLRSKIDHLPKSRFGSTLYLDSDTRVVDDLKAMFAILDRFEIALAHGHLRHGTRQEMAWREPVPAAFPQLNGGVILYRGSERVKAFLESWRKAYHEAAFKWDQITLRELMWLSDLRLYVLPPEYNVRYRKYLEIWSENEARAKILHFEEFYDATAALPNVAPRTDKSLKAKVKRAVKLLRKRLKL